MRIAVLVLLAAPLGACATQGPSPEVVSRLDAIDERLARIEQSQQDLSKSQEDLSKKAPAVWWRARPTIIPTTIPHVEIEPLKFTELKLEPLELTEPIEFVQPVEPCTPE